MGNAAKQNGCVVYSKDLTVMRAIDAVGGWNDFSSIAIYLIRNGKPTKVDLDVIAKTPAKDIRLEPWDILLVNIPAGQTTY